MIYLQRFLPLCIFSLLLNCQQHSAEVSPAAIIPLPDNIEVGSGHFSFDANTVINVANQDQVSMVKLFTSRFEKASDWAPEIKVKQTSGDVNLTHQNDISPEGYRLLINQDGIQIFASTDAGYFYALQTILQLLPPEFSSKDLNKRKQWSIPALEITDTPAFGWRGFMLDVSRHFFEVEEVKQILDLMASLKMNRFHWHLTDDQGWRIEIKEYPKLTEIGAWRVDYTNYDETISDWWGRPEQKPGEQATYGGFYTQEEIREIVDYAKAHFIEVIPEIDMPGHAQATIAAYPEIGCINAAPYVATGGVYKNNTYNPGKEETYEFVENVLVEVMDLFPFEYIHIGGDECNKEQWKIDPHAQRKIKEENLKDEDELQSYFIKRVEGIINKYDRKLIGWDEILEGGLAPNATVMSWRGEEGGIAAAQAGHDVIMTPSKFCYLDLKQGPDDLEPNLGYSHMFLKDAYQYEIIPADFSSEQAKHVLGTQANLWTESITDWGKLTYMTFPRVYAIAENAWTAEELQDWDGFVSRLESRLKRLDAQQVRYATSAFNVNIDHKGVEGGIEFTFKTEANQLEYFYSLDGSEPDTSAIRYHEPFILTNGANIKARAYRNGKPLGATTDLSFPIHSGSGASVNYITPYFEYKDAAGPNALVDYNYGSLTITDDNWQGFDSEMNVELQFSEPTLVQGVQFSNLRFTISGVYIPEIYQVHGSSDGKEYQLLGELELMEEGNTQGRNKITTKVLFDGIEVRSLRIIAKSPNPIPKGHHLAGQRSKLYIDEIVVL